MPKLRLTQVAVDRLKSPVAGERVEYWDTLLPAFGLRIAASKTGHEPRKTWQVMFRVRGQLVRQTLGTTAAIPKVDVARDLARASMAKAAQGIHPAEEREAAAEQERALAAADDARQRDTLTVAIDTYLERYAVKRMRPNYYAETKRAFDRDVKPALGARPIREVTRPQIRELLDAIVDRGAPSHANHVLAYLRAMLNWAVGNDLIDRNPVDGMKMPAPRVERERFLSEAEIKLFWPACDKIGWPYGPLFQLLLLTAQRLSEVAEATWAEFDLNAGLWVIPRERAKNNRAHIVHLSPLAVDILRSLPQIGTKGLLFTRSGERPVTGFGHAVGHLFAAMADLTGSEVEHFTIHDLRRSTATHMAGLSVGHHVVDKLLNHISGKISGVARVYNRHEYLPERKAALEAWSAHIEALVEAERSNIVAIHRTVNKSGLMSQNPSGQIQAKN